MSKRKFGNSEEKKPEEYYSIGEFNFDSTKTIIKNNTKSKKQDVQLSEGSTDNVNMSSLQQEDSNNDVNTSPLQQEGLNDIVFTSPIPAEKSLEDFLSNGSAPSEYILSDNETFNQQEFASRGSSKSSVMLLSSSQMQLSQESFHVQELFQVKSAEIPKKIRNVAVEGRRTI
ncbi:unnamed protein product [Rhizophagus irregularis]|nr:unnamed protein product [Rhizophagus irregularis]